MGAPYTPDLRERVVAQADRNALRFDAHQLARTGARELRDHDADRVRSRVDRTEPRARGHRGSSYHVRVGT